MMKKQFSIAALLVALLSVFSACRPTPTLSADGGAILVYAIDAEATQQLKSVVSDDADFDLSSIDMEAFSRSIAMRIERGSGFSHASVRPHGEGQVEISLPGATDKEVAVVKKCLLANGVLTFRVIAKERRNPIEWELAKAVLASEDRDVRASRVVRDGEENKIGEWVLVGREKTAGAPLKFSADHLEMFLTRQLKPGEVEIFVLYDEVFNVNGAHLRNISASFDRNGNPSVAFLLNSEGAVLFGGLTSSNLPDPAGKAPLGMIFNGELISAPVINSTITSRGVIEGRFTQAEVDNLVNVLRAGQLPAVLEKTPVSESSVEP